MFRNGSWEGRHSPKVQLDLQAFIREIEVERALLLERRLLDRLFESWLDEALLIDDFLPQEFVNVVGEIDWGWRWSGLPSIDRQKEAAGAEIELRNHTTTLAAEYARQNKDWEVEIRQRARELALMKELGLPTAQQAVMNSQSPQQPPKDVADPIEDDVAAPATEELSTDA